MSHLVEPYLDDSERRRWTVSTFLKRRGHDFKVHHGPLVSALKEREAAGTVVAVPSKGGNTAYLEVIE